MELKRAVDSKTRPHPRTEGLIESSDQRKGPRTKTLGDLVSRMKTTHQLTSLSHIFTNLKDYRPSIDHILDPPTSGYSSDCYEDDDKCNRISSLSYTEVKNLLMDTSVLKTLPDNGQVKEGSNVLMLISDIKLDLNFFRLRAFLNKLRTRPVLLKAKFFFYQDNYSLMLQFEKAEQVSSSSFPPLWSRLASHDFCCLLHIFLISGSINLLLNPLSFFLRRGYFTSLV